MLNKWESLKYQSGFGNEFSSEDFRCPGSLPQEQNTPQKFPYGLYPELLSGTAFTAPRESNRRSWLYRILPSVKHEPFIEINQEFIVSNWSNEQLTPNQLKWKPFEIETKEPVDFVKGLKSLCGAGDSQSRNGVAIYVYTCNTSMNNMAFYNSDGDFLIVPQQGNLFITTEFGKILVKPCEICVIQQGMKFSIEIDEQSRGYVLEILDNHFILPNLGPIGSNGLADPRHFLAPLACFDERLNCDFKIVNKFQGKLFEAKQDHTCFDVVSWHGTYYPYKYDLRKFNPMGTVSFDHSDPSIYTVLTCPSNKPGVAVADFVAFPPRWIVAEHTFRPPPFHRNCMTEFVGQIYNYSSPGSSVSAGGASLHSMMSPHGVDSDTYDNALHTDLKPTRVADDNLTIMFETSFNVLVSKWAFSQCDNLDSRYRGWLSYKSNFTFSK